MQALTLFTTLHASLKVNAKQDRARPYLQKHLSQLPTNSFSQENSRDTFPYYNHTAQSKTQNGKKKASTLKSNQTYCGAPNDRYYKANQHKLKIAKKNSPQKKSTVPFRSTAPLIEQTVLRPLMSLKKTKNIKEAQRREYERESSKKNKKTRNETRVNKARKLSFAEIKPGKFEHTPLRIGDVMIPEKYYTITLSQKETENAFQATVRFKPQEVEVKTNSYLMKRLVSASVFTPDNKQSTYFLEYPSSDSFYQQIHIYQNQSSEMKRYDESLRIEKRLWNIHDNFFSPLLNKSTQIGTKSYFGAGMILRDYYNLGLLGPHLKHIHFALQNKEKTVPFIRSALNGWKQLIEQLNTIQYLTNNGLHGNLSLESVLADSEKGYAIFNLESFIKRNYLIKAIHNSLNSYDLLSSTYLGNATYMSPLDVYYSHLMDKKNGKVIIKNTLKALEKPYVYAHKNLELFSLGNIFFSFFHPNFDSATFPNDPFHSKQSIPLPSKYLFYLNENLTRFRTEKWASELSDADILDHKMATMLENTLRQDSLIFSHLNDAEQSIILDIFKNCFKSNAKHRKGLQWLNGRIDDFFNAKQKQDPYLKYDL